MLPEKKSEYKIIRVGESKPTKTKSRAPHWIANAVPWRLSRRDNFVAKEPGQVIGGLTPPTLPAHTSAPLRVMTVGVNQASQVIIQDYHFKNKVFSAAVTQEEKKKKTS